MAKARRRGGRSGNQSLAEQRLNDVNHALALLRRHFRGGAVIVGGSYMNTHDDRPKGFAVLSIDDDIYGLAAIDAAYAHKCACIAAGSPGIVFGEEVDDPDET